MSSRNDKIYVTPFSDVYKLYIAKVERKGYCSEHVDEIIMWLTGYDKNLLHKQIDLNVDFQTFFDQAPEINENRSLIKGVICGYRVEDMEEGLMKNIRYLDKMIDELYKGKAMEKVLRGSVSDK